MLVLVVFCSAFSSFLATAGDDELYTNQRPLQLAELWSSIGVSSLIR